MKKHPLGIAGFAFAGVAVAEAIAVLMLLLFAPRESTMTFSLVTTLGLQVVIFGSIGIIFLCGVHRRIQRRERLVDQGYYEMATVGELERSYAVRINRRHPWYVICRIERDGVLHEYRSDLLWYRPSMKAGDTVRVYLDRQNENFYYVDVEDISPVVIHHG